jgi:hypothetical protein
LFNFYPTARQHAGANYVVPITWLRRSLIVYRLACGQPLQADLLSRAVADLRRAGRNAWSAVAEYRIATRVIISLDATHGRTAGRYAMRPMLVPAFRDIELPRDPGR